MRAIWRDAGVGGQLQSDGASTLFYNRSTARRKVLAFQWSRTALIRWIIVSGRRCVLIQRDCRPPWLKANCCCCSLSPVGGTTDRKSNHSAGWLAVWTAGGWTSEGRTEEEEGRDVLPPSSLSFCLAAT